MRGFDYMKKIISLISVFVMALSISCQIASAESLTPPTDGLALWLDASEDGMVEAIQSGLSLKVETWKDKSGNGKNLTQSNATYRPTFYTDSTKSNLKDDGAAIHFAKNNSLVSDDVNYSGSASFVMYYRQNSPAEGNTLFSSYPYTGSAVTETGKIPFSIVTNAQKGLSIKMSSEESLLDMNILAQVSEEDTSVYEGYRILYVTIDAGTKTVKVYSSRATEQTQIDKPVAQFSLKEVPYWKSYAYNVQYDGARAGGMIGDCAETFIYHKVLSIDEINKINKYLKLKYEYPVLSKLSLANEIYEIKKGDTFTPEIIGTGTLLGEESKVEISGATMKSSNTDSILVLGNVLKAVDFGTSNITIEYNGLKYMFTVSVPQVFINTPEIGDFNSESKVSIKQKIENFNENSPLDVIMAATLYKGDMLVDIEIEKRTITNDYTFNMELSKGKITDDCKIYIFILDGKTMVPLCEPVIR